MANPTNRHRKLPLSESWRHYWSVLFPGEGDWREGVEERLREALIDCSGSDAVEWVQSINFTIDDRSVWMQLGNCECGPLAYFSKALVERQPPGSGPSPIERVLGSDLGKPLHASLRNSSERQFANAVAGVGNQISSAVINAIKSGDFEVYGAKATDPTAKVTRIPAHQLRGLERLNVADDELAFRAGTSIICGAMLKRATRLKGKAGAHGNFDASDEPLLKEMKRLMVSGECRSARAAAKKVEPDAKRRSGTDPENVIRRLLDKFSRNYPGYTTKT